MSDDESDSRVASVGLARLQSTSNPHSRASSKDESRKKGSRETDGLKPNDFQEFVPAGGQLAATSLATDSRNSSASSDSDSHEEPEQKMSKRRRTNAPAINWNQGRRSAIRTSLRPRTTLTSVKNTVKTSFDAVNDKYFRSRSASASDGETNEDKHTESTEVRQKGDNASKTYFVDDSDGSDIGELSEGGDSMMLNIGHHNRNGVDGAQDSDHTPHTSFLIDTAPSLQLASVDASIDSSQQEEQDTLDVGENGTIASDRSLSQLPLQSKAEAFAEFAAIYKTTPAILADLKVKDLEKQARFFFYNSHIHELDLTRPISCTECLAEGHLAFICPSKECNNCGAWNLHEDRLCPTVRRCQRCRQVGHDSHSCPSSLKASATETPCDYCGADTHTEYDCDKMWKFPTLEPLEGPVKVSISCSYCTNKNHLLGDCPLRKGPSTSSTFSLKEYVPSNVTNLNSVLGPKKLDDQGMSIRGRAVLPQGTLSPEDEDSLVLHHSRSQPNTRGGRGKISFKGSLGQNRGLHGEPPPPLPREPPPPQMRDYRSRNDDFHRYRPRSRSPGPRDLQRGQSFGLPPRGSGRGGRGRGRGRGRDQYRPGRP